MVGMNSVGAAAYGVGSAQSKQSKDISKNKSEEVKESALVEQVKKTDYGKTVGKPELSDEAKKYYESLKKKFGNYDFVLVSKDQINNVKANAAKYANPYKTVVLIDEEKIERMATDESYRKKYEGILSGAEAKFAEIRASIEKTGANVKGYGLQVNSDGTTSYFAVLKKQSADEKIRIEKKIKQRREEKKADEKKALKKANEERLKDIKNDKNVFSDDEATVIIKATSAEELIKQIEERAFEERSNNVTSEAEKQIGQHIDFRG